MALDKLTPSQEAWCLRATPASIAAKIADGTLSLERMQERAARRPAFAPKMRSLEALAASMPNPKEEQEYNTVMAQVATDALGEATGRMLADYISRWNSSAPAAERIAAAQVALAANRDARRGQIEEQWQSLIDFDGSIMNIAPVKAFLAANPDYIERADDALWDYAKAQDNTAAAVNDYLATVGLSGRHRAEASALLASLSEWNAVDHNNFNDVIAFINRHAGEPVADTARHSIERLKGAELDAIRNNRIGYRPPRFRELWASGIYTKEELCEAADLTDEDFDRIINLPQIEADLPDVPSPAIVAGASGVTDIIFFGIPSSGKSCILTGLFNTDNIDFDRVNWSGVYATALQDYGRAGVAPPPTSLDVVALVKSSVRVGKDTTYHFNLVDMAGESYRTKIAQMENLDQEIETSFADMGEGAPEVLASPNDKVFFIVLDATASDQRRRMQRVSLNNLISLMFGTPEGGNPNADIMKRVSALHFIVTKADTLEEPRLDKARELLHDLINSAGREALVRSCRDHGINATDNKDTDGVPRVFCFSLGKFHMGNTFTYDSSDSDKLLEVISDHVMPVKDAGVLYSVRKFFTTPII